MREAKKIGGFHLSVYDSQDLMEFHSASREYGISLPMIEKAVAEGRLRAIDVNKTQRLLRFDVENFVKRMVKRGYGDRIATGIGPT